MNFTQQSQPMTAPAKPKAKDKLDEGKRQIGNFAAKTAARPEVQAGIQAGKKGLNKAKKLGLSLIGMGDESSQQPQPQLQQQTGQNFMGGKRRRKSRRKKRTKRRRKSRRKKRRTKRRRKSRRKRRR